MSATHILAITMTVAVTDVFVVHHRSRHHCHHCHHHHHHHCPSQFSITMLFSLKSKFLRSFAGFGPHTQHFSRSILGYLFSTNPSTPRFKLEGRPLPSLPFFLANIIYGRGFKLSEEDKLQLEAILPSLAWIVHAPEGSVVIIR